MKKKEIILQKKTKENNQIWYYVIGLDGYCLLATQDYTEALNVFELCVRNAELGYPKYETLKRWEP